MTSIKLELCCFGREEMRVQISKITRRFGVKSFLLHKCREYGWLGTELVFKYSEKNDQRTYNKQQV